MKLSALFVRLWRRKLHDFDTFDEEYLGRTFPSEAELTSGRSARVHTSHLTAGWRTYSRRDVAAGITVTAAALAGVAVYSTAASVQPLGSLRVESDPSAAVVELDGRVQGKTPLALKVNSGRHDLVVQAGARRRQLFIEVEAGTTTVHHIDLPDVATSSRPAAAAGHLEVLTSTPHANVTIDGVSRGQAPVTARDLPAGPHTVVVTAANATYRRTVNVQAGTTTSLLVDGTAAANQSGWLSTRAPLPLQVLEQGHVVGTTDSERIMLPAGQHEFEFANQALGFRVTRRVVIGGGQVAVVNVALPEAPLQINAIPWAEVWIDGERVGETPLANVSETIGPHEIVFRHPQLGEKHLTTTVTLNTPARATIDMRTR